MVVNLRVQSAFETWLRTGNRMRYVRTLGYVVGGVGVTYVFLGLVAYALDVEGCRTGRRRVPDELLLGNFPGAYGLLETFGTEMLRPRSKVSERIAEVWEPAELGMRVALECGWSSRAPAMNQLFRMYV